MRYNLMRCGSMVMAMACMLSACSCSEKQEGDPDSGAGDIAGGTEIEIMADRTSVIKNPIAPIE